MKLHIDKEADALYLRLDDSKIIESEEVSPVVVLDFNEHNKVDGSRHRDSAQFASLAAAQFPRVAIPDGLTPEEIAIVEGTAK